MHATLFLFFFFNDTATTEIYTLSLHDALPISMTGTSSSRCAPVPGAMRRRSSPVTCTEIGEHTSELQSPCNLVCRLLLEKKKKKLVNTDVSRCTIQYAHLASMMQIRVHNVLAT